MLKNRPKTKSSLRNRCNVAKGIIPLKQDPASRKRRIKAARKNIKIAKRVRIAQLKAQREDASGNQMAWAKKLGREKPMRKKQKRIATLQTELPQINFCPVCGFNHQEVRMAMAFAKTIANNQ